MPVGAYAVASDTGRKRRRNEDTYVVAPPLFAVADGMGGAQAGEVASKLAASALEDTDSDGLERDGAGRRADPGGEPARLRPRSTDPAASGMGTTMTVALVEGDDRRDRPRRRLARLPRPRRADGAADRGPLARERAAEDRQALAEEAEVHPQRAVITRAVGTDPDVDVDAFTIEAEDGDVFLICSDGLTTWSTTRTSSSSCSQNRDDLDKAVEVARHRGEPRRRRGQHHRGRLPDLVRGGAERRATPSTMPAITVDERRTSRTSRRASTSTRTPEATR